MPKNKEINYTEQPKYLYQLTQDFMLAYIENMASPDDQIWFSDLVEASQKTVTRGNKTFTATDTQKVRDAFARKFFKYLVEKKSNNHKPSYVDKVRELRKKAEEQKAKGNKSK